MTAQEAPDQAHRGLRRLLVDRDFGSFFWGRLVTVSAVYVHSVVAAIVVFEATRSAVAVALVTVAQFAPQLVLALAAGKSADRGGIARQIIAGRLICALGSAGLALWLALGPNGSGWATAWIVVCFSFITGLGLVTGGPAMQSVTPRLVRRSELATGMTLNSAPMSVGRVVGPAAGAALVQWIGASDAFAVAAVGHLFFAGLMVIIRIPGDGPVEAGGSGSQSIRESLRYVWQDRPLLLLILVVSGMGFGSEPLTSLAPVLSHELGEGATGVGALTAGFGVGAGLGIVLGSWRGLRLPQEILAGAGIGLLALGLVGCALSPTLEIAVVAVALAGAGFITAVSAASTLIQIRVPGAMRGRVMALWLMGFVGSRPVAAVSAGALADVLSARSALMAVAAIVLVIGFLCRPARLAGVPAGGVRRGAPGR